jgi:hypothetical protein
MTGKDLLLPDRRGPEGAVSGLRKASQGGDDGALGAAKCQPTLDAHVPSDRATTPRFAKNLINEHQFNALPQNGVFAIGSQHSASIGAACA